MRTGSLVFSRAGRQVKLDVVAVFQFSFLVAAELGVVQQVNALGSNGGDQVIQISGGSGHVIRQNVVHIAVGQIALAFANFDQSINIVFMLVVMLMIVFEFIVARQNAPTLFCKADSAPSSAAVQRLVQAAPKKSLVKTGKLGAYAHGLKVIRIKKRFRGFARNRMTSASGFTWVAREPRLIVGAKGRASAQRILGYHNRTRYCQPKIRATSRAYGQPHSRTRHSCLPPALATLSI
jgi:hypothetical protein